MPPVFRILSHFFRIIFGKAYSYMPPVFRILSHFFRIIFGKAYSYMPPVFRIFSHLFRGVFGKAYSYMPPDFPLDFTLYTHNKKQSDGQVSWRIEIISMTILFPRPIGLPLSNCLFHVIASGSEAIQPFLRCL